MARGRPKLTYQQRIFYIKLRLHPERDQTLIAALDESTNKARTVRDLLTQSVNK